MLGLQCPKCFANQTIPDVLCATANSDGLVIGGTIGSSGDADLDQNLIAEMTKQSGFFGYRPAFLLYSGGDKNAAATPKMSMAMTDGTIYYSIEMMKEQLLQTKWGGAIIAGVIAHEFGHIYQNFSNAMPRLRSLDKTAKFVELHADFLSGFYMASKDRTIEVKPYADAFFKFGDYGFTNARHHGTPEERYFLLKAGYNYRLSQSSASVADAAKEAETVLKEYIKA
jgi:hypothetical protein